jgi:hypothetical protein
MPLNLPRERTVNESFTPFIRYAARTGVFSNRDDHGELVELAELVAIADLPDIKVGWLKFVTGASPDIVWDRNGVVDKPPSREHRRGFALKLLLPSFGVRELSSTSGGLIAAITSLYDRYEGRPESARGLLPVVRCTRLVPLETAYGVVYDPQFEIDRWVDRPVELPAPKPQTATLPAVSAKGRPAAGRSIDSGLDDSIPF